MITKGILFYTDNRLEGTLIGKVAQKRIIKSELPIVSVSLEPIKFGRNIVVSMPRSIETMFYQILTGLIACETDIVFMCEHDVVYSPEHFRVDSIAQLCYHYNQHNWKLNMHTGDALFYYCKQTLGLVGYRDLLIEHYAKRLERIMNKGSYEWSIGFEPGCHVPPRGIDHYPAIGHMTKIPNIDLRHGKNLTKSRWSTEEFRDKRTCQGWTESEYIPFWGVTKNRPIDFLQDILEDNYAFQEQGTSYSRIELRNPDHFQDSR